MTAQCPYCEQTYLFADEQAGQTLHCGNCLKEFRAVAVVPIGTPPAEPVIPEYASPAARIPSNVLATASLLLGVAFFVPLASVLAIVFGIAGLRRSRAPGVPGRRRAMAGIILGGLFVAVLPVVFIDAHLKARDAGYRVQEMADLRHIGQGIMIYAMTYNGQCPADLGAVYGVGGTPGGLFIDPATSNALPANWATMSPAAQAKWISANSDFAYDGAGFGRISRVKHAASVIIAHETYNHHGAGSAALFLDGHAEFLTPAQLGQGLALARGQRATTQANP